MFLSMNFRNPSVYRTCCFRAARAALRAARVYAPSVEGVPGVSARKVLQQTLAFPCLLSELLNVIS
jgi:hypothetical protein